EAGALKALAHAGRTDDTSSYTTDIGHVEAASRKLSAAPAGLRRFELALPRFGTLRLASAPQASETYVGGSTGSGAGSSTGQGASSQSGSSSNQGSAPPVTHPVSNQA
ncbi:hypothetical protein, partial [Actinospica sp.]|uniref:hypothetical protein n=1 Tax=Actinospica sp. TaxID=1872142 RepID=UPI002C21930D